MKKIISIICVIILSTSLISCDSDNNSPYQSSKNNSNGAYNEIAEYTVRYNTNGGSSVKSEKTTEIRHAPTTTKKDHLFDGWFLDETLTVAAVFPLELTKDTTLYARWLKTSSTTTCTSCKIKWDSDIGESKIYKLTPSGFNLTRLQEKEYRSIEIKAEYDVYYKKDYNIIGDIGYMGAPKFEVYLLNSNKVGQFQEDIKAQTSPVHRSITYNILISDIPSDSITLEFSTNNIQNIIYFENIVVTYTCKK